MIKRHVISAFKDENSGMRINGSIAFANEDKCLLYNKNHGCMMLFNNKYLGEIQNKKISKAFIRKLASRGFVNDSTEICCNDSCEVLPEFFIVDLTNKCNMRCRYCLRDVEAKDESISEETIRNICNYINEYCEKEHLKNVSIQPWGGEPLMELQYILMMRKFIHPKGTKVHFSIETNGILLTQEILEILYQNKIGIGISIDGFSKVHDSQRITILGEGTHEIVEKNLLLAKSIYGNRIGIITTITKNNAKYIEDILEYFACDLELKSVKINFVHESMFSDSEGLCLTKEEISETELKILHKLVELNKSGYKISEYNMRVKVENLLYKKYSDICHSKGCCGGKKMIAFDLKGNIYPCELTDTLSESIGNIYDQRGLISLVYDAIKKRDYFVSKRNDECSKCDWYIFCQGGCTVRTISRGKRPPEIDEIECAVNKTLYSALVELILNDPKIINSLLDYVAL